MVLSTTFTQFAPEMTKFRKITRNKGHVAVQGHSRSSHRFGVLAFQMSEIAIYHYPLAFKSPDGGVPLGRSP